MINSKWSWFVIARVFVYFGIIACGVLAGLTPAQAVSFDLTAIAGDTLSAEQSAAFVTAASAWSLVLTDPVTVRIDIGFRDLGTVTGGAAVLGATAAAFGTVPYGDLINGLMADASSAADRMAVAHFPAATPSSRVTLTLAQARAVGFAAATTSDGSIEFTSNSKIAFAATRPELTGANYDLIGVAEHEIGHLLGFQSALDLGTTSRTALDLFRYASVGTPGFTAGQAAYFSTDGGATSLGSFSVGGSGQYQASHWLQGTGGLMDPAVRMGVATNITGRDTLALDVVGWDVAVAEPASGAVLLAGLGVLGLWRMRWDQRTSQAMSAPRAEKAPRIMTARAAPPCRVGPSTARSMLSLDLGVGIVGGIRELRDDRGAVA